MSLPCRAGKTEEYIRVFLQFNLCCYAGSVAVLGMHKKLAESTYLGKGMPSFTLDADTMIGVQLYGLREQVAANRVDTLQQLKEMGYEAVEPVIMLSGIGVRWNPSAWTMSSFERDFEEIQELGFAVPSVHLNLGLLCRKPDKIMRQIQQIHTQTGISNFVISGMFASEKDAKKWGNLLHTISDGIKEQGCSILYHNHDGEFTPVSNGRVLDYFFTYAGDDVMLQLDIGWAGIAWDELLAAQKYKDRIVEIHCKDFVNDARNGYSLYKMPKEYFVPIGEGTIRTKEILSMTDIFPYFNGVIIIDQDQSATSILDDVKIGLQNVRRMVQ